MNKCPGCGQEIKVHHSFTSDYLGRWWHSQCYYEHQAKQKKSKVLKGKTK